MTFSTALTTSWQATRERFTERDRASAGSEISLESTLDWQRPVLDDYSFTLLLTGSAGGGKSRLAAFLLHRFMMQNPGAAGLVMRKAREWTNKSIVPFLKQTVVKKDARYKKSDMWFEYPNGSLLYIGGMKDDDQREAVRSIGGDGGLDMVWFEEANAFTEEDYNEIIGRMRAKAGTYRQIVLTTNPDRPNHWINQRLIIGGEAKVYYSGAKDNPFNPPEYINNLELLTGTQYERLVLGKWVLAEGAIYDTFSLADDGNVTADADYSPAKGVTYWGGDDGYAYGKGPGAESYHPRAFLMVQRNHLGGIDVFQEYEKAGVHDQHSTINELLETGYPKPDLACIDSASPTLIATLFNDYDIAAIGATHEVGEGIKVVRQMICDGRGIRLIRIHPRCKRLIACLQSYRYSDSIVSRGGESKPLKIDDHLPDCLRYLCWILSAK